MTDTKSQLESMITYLLGVMWENGEALRKATPGDSLKHAKTIRMLALSINQLQWISYDEAEANAKPEPKAEQGWQPIETAPKDTPVLLYEPNLKARYVSRWVEEPYPHWRGYGQGDDPSHWYPLPGVPTDAAPQPKPDAPQTEPAEWDKEQETESEEEPTA